MIVILASAGGLDAVSFTYPRHVSPAQARQDLKRLLDDTGWQAQGLRISDGVGPTVKAGMPPMTGVEFETQWAIIPSSGGFPLAPILRAFARYKDVGALFLVPAGFRYNGPPAYSDSDVDLTLDAHPGSFLFHATIKREPDRSFQLPVAPARRTDRPAESGTANAATPAGSPLVRVLAVILLALGVGAVVYSLSNWWTANRSREATH